jgi:hypothetical protein
MATMVHRGWWSLLSRFPTCRWSWSGHWFLAFSYFDSGDVEEVDAIRGSDGDDGRRERLLRDAEDVDRVGVVDPVGDGHMDVVEKLDFPISAKEEKVRFLFAVEDANKTVEVGDVAVLVLVPS